MNSRGNRETSSLQLWFLQQTSPLSWDTVPSVHIFVVSTWLWCRSCCCLKKKKSVQSSVVIWFPSGPISLTCRFIRHSLYFRNIFAQAFWPLKLRRIFLESQENILHFFLVLLISEIWLKKCTVAERDKVEILIFVFGSITYPWRGDLFRLWEVHAGGPRGPASPPRIVASQQDTADANGKCPSARQGGAPSSRFCGHV